MRDLKPFFSVQPRFDESLGSYALRVSEANSGFTADALLRAGFSSSSRMSFDKAGYFAEFCRADPAAVVALSGYWRKGSPTAECLIAGCWIPGRPHVVRACSAVCPECLAEAPYCRAEWELALYPCCPVHELSLIDTCPRCGRPLGIRRPHVCRCSCGHDLRRSECGQPSQNAVEVARALHVAFWGRNSRHAQASAGRIGSMCSGADTAAIPAQFWFLAVTLPALIANRPIRGQGMMSKRQAMLAVEELADILSNWPEAFVERLDYLFAARTPAGVTAVESVFRVLWLRIVRLTLPRDELNMRGAFQSFIRSRRLRSGRMHSLRACLNQLELPFE